MNERAKPQGTRRSGVGTGTTSLLMIFTVLCFATLAMLSLSTAAADRRIQQRGMDLSAGAAAAKGAAATAVAALDAELAEIQSKSPPAAGPAAYYAAAETAAARLGWQTDAENHTLTLYSPVNESNELITILQLHPPHTAGRYAVLSQSTVLIEGWKPEEEGGVWMPGQ